MAQKLFTPLVVPNPDSLRRQGPRQTTPKPMHNFQIQWWTTGTLIFPSLPISSLPSLLSWSQSEKPADKGNDHRLNFAYYHNPNGQCGCRDPYSNETYWPRHDYSSYSRNMLSLKSGNVTVIEDNYREAQISFFVDNAKQFNARWFPV